MPNENDYIIIGGRSGKSRLNVLAEVMEPYTLPLLLAQGLSEGCRLLDVGCGGGHVTMMAAHVAGPAGRTEGIDFDEEIIALNRHEAAVADISNIIFRAASAYDIDYHKEFDIAYARFLLSHLQHPAAVLQKMVQAVKPGGRVVAEDIHFSGHFCYPECQAFTTYVDYFTRAAAHSGHNAEIGPELVSLFKEAGLQDVGFNVVQPVFSSGPGKRMAWLTLDRIKSALTRQGIATEKEINHMLDKLDSFTRDENTLISLPRIFSVWGTVPRED